MLMAPAQSPGLLLVFQCPLLRMRTKMVTLKSESTYSPVRKSLSATEIWACPSFDVSFKSALAATWSADARARFVVELLSSSRWCGLVRTARGHNRMICMLATEAISIEGSTLRRRKAKSDDHTRCTRIPRIQDEGLFSPNGATVSRIQTATEIVPA